MVRLERSWRFSDTTSGAEAAANLCNLISMAKAHGLKPRRYVWYEFCDLPGASRVAQLECTMPGCRSDEYVETALGTEATAL